MNDIQENLLEARLSNAEKYWWIFRSTDLSGKSLSQTLCMVSVLTSHVDSTKDEFIQFSDKFITNFGSGMIIMYLNYKFALYVFLKLRRKVIKYSSVSQEVIYNFLTESTLVDPVSHTKILFTKTSFIKRLKDSFLTLPTDMLDIRPSHITFVPNIGTNIGNLEYDSIDIRAGNFRVLIYVGSDGIIYGDLIQLFSIEPPYQVEKEKEEKEKEENYSHFYLSITEHMIQYTKSDIHFYEMVESIIEMLEKKK